MRVFTLTVLICLASCRSGQSIAEPVKPVPVNSAEDYADQVIGVWSSDEQSTDPDYDNVYSETTRILVERDAGFWLLQQNWILGPDPIESFSRPGNVASSKPYFQVVIHVRDLGDGALHTTTYRLSDEAAKKNVQNIYPEFPETGLNFKPEWLGDIACMGRMQRVGEGFWEGSATCPNGYKGGVKVESRSVRAPGIYTNWDRGFDASGNHIWGPSSGGYIFKRKDLSQ